MTQTSASSVDLAIQMEVGSGIVIYIFLFSATYIVYDPDMRKATNRYNFGLIIK